MRRNLLITVPNHVIMAVTTIVSTLFHGGLFLAFGASIFLSFSALSSDGKMSISDYETLVGLFVLCMFHCLVLIFLLERSPVRRTWGFSMVTLVLEIIIFPFYTLVWLGVIEGTWGHMFLLPAALMLVSLIGNIYCIVRHTITK